MFTAAPRTARSLLAAPTQYPRCAEPLSPRLSQVTASARRESLSSIASDAPGRRAVLACSLFAALMLARRVWCGMSRRTV